MSALTADGLTRRFGDLVAVNNLTFEVPDGVVVGFVGPNGSGKSTTIRVLLGLIEASGGTGTVLGEPIEHPERFADRVGALIESPALVGSLSGRDNLRSLGCSGDRSDRTARERDHQARESVRSSLSAPTSSRSSCLPIHPNRATTDHPAAYENRKTTDAEAWRCSRS